MTYSMEALGWTLVHFCWQAAVIALLYRVVDFALLSKTRSNVRYGLALVALLSMFAVSVATFGYEELQASRDAIPSKALTSDVAHEILGRLSSLSIADLGFAKQSNQRPDPSAYLARLLPWLDAAWLLGVLALSLRTIGGWWLIQQLRRTGLVQVPDRVRISLASLSQRMGIKRPIDLRVSGRISGPLAMGVFRSLILLPASTLTALSPEQLEVVLAHELAHIRRADYLWNMVQTMIETLFFFHPAVWWVSNNLRQQRELCCDDVALACCSDPLVYATALLCLEEQRGQRLHLAMALDGHQTTTGLRARVVRILGEAPQGRREIAPLSLFGLCAMLGLFLLPLPHVFASLTGRAEQTVQMLGSVVVSSPAPRIVVAVDSRAEPAAAPASAAAAKPIATVAAAPRMSYTEAQASSPASASGAAMAAPKSDYISQMRAAGYDVDMDKYIAMKIQGVTPEFAQSMAAMGFGKPTVDELVSLKIFRVTPDSLRQLRASGLEPTNFKDLVSYQIFKVTPEFVAGMKEAGFSSIPPKQLVALRVQGVTPEYARTTKQQFPDITLDQLVQLRIFRIDDAFIASAKSRGFERLTIDKLVKLRISGLLDDNNQRSEKQ
ncbi:MAG: peptidase BlaR1 [Edaphobacter sp.]|nr:peptidase BlaR1 [Edaphobacter sp.]